MSENFSEKRAGRWSLIYLYKGADVGVYHWPTIRVLSV